MTILVSKSTVIENIYKNIYDLVSSITGFSTICYPAFPYINIDDKADYPIIIIDSPEISNDTFTFGKGKVEGSVSIDIYTTSAATTDSYSSDIIDKIETSKFTLAGLGLRRVHLTNTSTDSVSHGKIRVHLKTLTFEYKFYYIGTEAF